MNPKETYLALLRTQYPKLYYAALLNVFGPKSGLGGLGDDLLNTVDSGGSTDIGVTSDVSAAIDSAYNAATSPDSTTQGGGTDYFAQIADAVTKIAPTIVQTQAAENLLSINTQRAQRGLPLYTSQGQLVTSSMLTPTNATLAQMESALSGGSSSWVPVLLVGGLAVAALLLSGNSRKAV